LIVFKPLLTGCDGEKSAARAKFQLGGVGSVEVTLEWIENLGFGV
jgi:hypothetical protein